MVLPIAMWIEVAGAGTFPFKKKGNGVLFYRNLIEKLADEGFDERRLRTIFADSRILFHKEVLDRNIVFRESKADYSSFTLPSSVTLAKRFISKNRSFLESLESDYGTSKEVIVAILLVESSLGRRTGRYGVVTVFSSLSMLSWPHVAEPCKTWLKGRHPELTDAYFEKRRKAKSQWAFNELVHLLRLEEKEMVIDVLKMNGSWAGAYGICQFLPSSLHRFGADGDGDGKIDLDKPSDAMASVANYLKGTGWKEGLSTREKQRVILKYNYSKLYVDTILEITDRLGKDAK
jgi:membrane-bound lytic murein transglycosylase B